MTLDTVCVSLHKEGVGAEVKHATVISIEHEEILWKNGVLGVNSPESLLRTVFLHCGFVLQSPRRSRAP